ncbi:MAG: hypothetical protein ABJD11_07895 [Gemmatimonadota bacterium]
MSEAIPVRVMVQDAWDEVDLSVPGGTRIGELKRRALTMTHVTRDPEGYMMKFRGAELTDEGRSLTEAGIMSNAALIVMPRRRRPLR